MYLKKQCQTKFFTKQMILLLNKDKDLYYDIIYFT